jgi:hypothetical protein
VQPGDTLIGVIVMGMGVLLAYSAYKNVPVVGSNGLLTSAIQSGKLPAVPSPSGSTPSGNTPGGTAPHLPPGPNPHGTVQ